MCFVEICFFKSAPISSASLPWIIPTCSLAIVFSWLSNLLHYNKNYYMNKVLRSKKLLMLNVTKGYNCIWYSLTNRHWYDVPSLFFLILLSISWSTWLIICRTFSVFVSLEISHLLLLLKSLYSRVLLKVILQIGHWLRVDKSKGCIAILRTDWMSLVWG